MKSRIFQPPGRGIQESSLFRFTVGVLRIMYGILWLQQAKWKVPPDFGMKTGDGLWYWLNQAIQYPTWSVHHAFLTNVVLPNFILFGYLTLLTEAFIGLSLTFGLFARLGGLVGLLMAINVTLSVLKAPNEWHWTYFMLIGYSLLFLSFPSGRMLGLDSLLSRRLANKRGRSTQLLSWIV
ncbi:MAG: TQO small subunit DoxD [Candidatus Methylomirabilis oxyfera]|nr:TQO small subunit DoxD [Candidatus Methylomirabilis oxyfera]